MKVSLIIQPIIIIALLPVAINTSFIFVDWTVETPDDLPIKLFLLDYSPPIGVPPPNSHLPADMRQTLINRTLAATDYNIAISAVLDDGSVRMLVEREVASSPDAPELDTITMSDTEAMISYYAPEGDHLSYYLEYFPIDHEEFANFVETTASAVVVRGLKPAQTYRVRILSVYHGVPSANSIDTVMTTLADKSGGTSAESHEHAIQFIASTTTQPSSTANLFLSSKRTRRPILISTFPPTTTTTTATSISTTVFEGKEYQEEEEPLITTTTTTILPTTTTTEVTTTTILPETRYRTTKSPKYGNTTRSGYLTTKSTKKISSNGDDDGVTDEEDNDQEDKADEDQQDKVGDGHVDQEEDTSQSIPINEPPVIIIDPRPSMPGMPEPSPLTFEKTGAKMQLNISWSAPSLPLICDVYVLNYTILPNHRSSPNQSDDDPTNNNHTSSSYTTTFAIVKLFVGNRIQYNIFCKLSESITTAWWASDVADLRKPNAVTGMRLVSYETDEFYVSKVVIAWDWPSNAHDFDKYRLLVSYSQGSTMTKQRRDIEVKQRHIPIIIDKHLEPTEMYTFIVRNISIAFDISSQAIGITQRMPPIISSTLYPGQLSSTAININFGTSDPEQGRFDYYELVFTGVQKNITKRLELDDDRSFTFTSLIPGKTYQFELYTVFDGVRSRPVTANITTYPLKVNKLYPVLGRDYATLYWDVENKADNDVRYRLSYSGTSNTGFQSTSTVELHNKNKHKFGNLDAETYYTFTITVIMGQGAAEAESESESITVGFGSRARSVPILERYSNRELALTIENDHNSFTDTNGVISNFAIIVTEDVQLGGDDFELASWHDVQNQSVWPAYRASRSNYNPFEKRTVKSTTFIIGEDNCDVDGKHHNAEEHYCNGALKSHVDYSAKVRAYSVSNVALETEWVSVNGVVDLNAKDQTTDKPSLPCHLYLNGCPRSSGTMMTTSTLTIVVLTIISCYYLFTTRNVR